MNTNNNYGKGELEAIRLEVIELSDARNFVEWYNSLSQQSESKEIYQ